MPDVHSEIDRAAADGKISPGDAAAVHAFADLLEGKHEGCANCLSLDHTLAAQCPEITDAERRGYGVMRIDVAYGKLRDKHVLSRAVRRG